jgi:hypothetical protein
MMRPGSLSGMDGPDFTAWNGAAGTACPLAAAGRLDGVLTAICKGKGNQPGLRRAICDKVSAECGTAPDYARLDDGHGRIIRRSIRGTGADGIDFPCAAQVTRIRRDAYGLTGTALAREIMHGITGLDPGLGIPGVLAGLTRGNGASNRSAGYAIPPAPKIATPAIQATAPRPWPPCGTSPSACPTWPGSPGSTGPCSASPATGPAPRCSSRYETQVTNDFPGPVAAGSDLRASQGNARSGRGLTSHGNAGRQDALTVGGPRGQGRAPAPYRGRCNSISPGAAKTPMTGRQGAWDMPGGTEADLPEGGCRFTALKGTALKGHRAQGAPRSRAPRSRMPRVIADTALYPASGLAAKVDRRDDPGRRRAPRPPPCSPVR